MSIYSDFKPTYLYIKQHSITGKLYFGKTCRQHHKMLQYLGGGVHWTNHIKKHGPEHVVTLWYCLFLDIASISEFALSFSSNQNIVESDDWLNLKPENGLDGGGRPGIKSGKLSQHHKEAISKSLKGLTPTEEHRKSLSKALLGKTASEETKAKMSAKRKGISRGPYKKKFTSTDTNP